MIDYDRLTLKGDADYYVSGDATEAGRLQGKGLWTDLEKAGTQEAGDRDARTARRPTRSRPTSRRATRRCSQPKFDSGDYTLAAEQAVPNWDGQQALTIFEQMLQKTGNKIDGVRRRQRHARQLGDLRAAGPQARPRADHRARRDGRRGPAHPRRRAVDDGVLLDQGPGDEGRQPGRPDRPRREADRRRRPRSTTGTKKVPTIFLKPVTIRKDNIADTVIADDFVSWDEVCVGKYEKYCPDATADGRSDRTTCRRSSPFRDRAACERVRRDPRGRSWPSTRTRSSGSRSSTTPREFYTPLRRADLVGRIRAARDEARAVRGDPARRPDAAVRDRGAHDQRRAAVAGATCTRSTWTSTPTRTA